MTEPMTINQVIARNVRRARTEFVHLTQAEAAGLLGEALGERWSIASWSAMEQSVGGDRVRRFDADLLVALARIFLLPVPWFFVPPPGRRVKLGREGVELSPRELLELVIPPEPGSEDEALDPESKEEIVRELWKDAGEILYGQGEYPPLIGRMLFAVDRDRVRHWREMLQQLDATLQAQERALAPKRTPKKKTRKTTPEPRN